MAWNGDGTFTRSDGTLTGTAICETQENASAVLSGSRMDTDLNTIVAGLENCMTLDGQTTPTANIPMGGNKLTGLAEGVASGEAVHFGQFEATAFTPTATAAGGGGVSGGSFLQANYATVGGLIFVNVEYALFLVSGTVSSISLSGLPFTVGSNWVQSVYAHSIGTTNKVGVVQRASGSSLRFYPPESASTFTAGSGNYISFHGIIR